MIRKTIFWTHLVCGVAAGVVVFMMSLTGVILTYERQMLHWFERADYVPADQRTVPAMSVDALLEISTLHDPSFSPGSIAVTNHPGAPVALSAGRGGAMQLNPYTGETMEIGSEGLDEFFSTVTGWHRWFNIQGEGRTTARAITGACNLMFLFLILSGIYLWLPRLWKWAMFKARLFFISRPPSGQARDFNWHHVFGIWSALPLALIVASATVFNYPWANNLVYQVYGEEPPQRGRGGGAAPAPGAGMDIPIAEDLQFLSMDELMQAARSHAENERGDWHSISLTIPAMTAEEVEFSVNQSLGGQPQKQFNLTLSRTSGKLESLTDYTTQSPGQRTRSIIRFLHTGEVLGFWGQTIAGLVSFTSLFMVWTGFALAWRRLVSPLFRRRVSSRRVRAKI